MELKLGRPASLLLLLSLPALLLAGAGLSRWVPPLLWWPSLVMPDPASLAQIVAADSLLPRIAVALLCGAALGLSGSLAQLALRNPLASPGTLGVSAGAALALSAATLYAPGLLATLGRDAIAFAGGAAGIGLVLALTLRGGLDPATVALAGLAVGLYAGSVAAILAVLNTRQLAGLFVWNAGSLTQLGWGVPRQMLAALALAGGVTALLSRPLALLELPDEVARGLGVPVGLVRAVALLVSVALAAATVAQVGVIGFVGLAAPALARLGGAGRRTLLWSPLLAAGLLLLTDQLVQALAGTDGALLPTGAFTALLGAPLLLWLLPRVAAGTAAPARARSARLAATPASALAGLAATSLLVAALALLAGRTGVSADALVERAPRAAAAAMAGAALGLAGTILQRVLVNPMASPEVLGLGTGAIGGGALALWLGLGGFASRLGFGVAGAGVVLVLLLVFARGGAASTRIVLAGIALSAAGEAAIALLLAGGSPAAETVLLWIAGSTYGASPGLVRLAALLLLALLLACAAAIRWLEILPLGVTIAGGRGVPVVRARTALLALATVLTALGSVLAGPLSFVGLVAPHVARLLGLHRAALQLPAASLAGATVMLAADWLGRVALFPSEIPAGLLAALLGGPVLLGALSRGRA